MYTCADEIVHCHLFWWPYRGAVFKLTWEGDGVGLETASCCEAADWTHEARSSGRPWPTSRLPAGTCADCQCESGPATHNKNHQHNNTMFAAPISADALHSPAWDVPRIVGSTLRRSRRTASIARSGHFGAIDENPAVESSSVAQQHRPALIRLKLSVSVKRASQWS